MSYEDKVFIVCVVGTVLAIALMIAALVYTGVNTENNRLYEKCLAKNSEMMYNKAIEYCEEQVK